MDEWTHQLTLIGQLRLTGLHVTCVLIGTISVAGRCKRRTMTTVTRNERTSSESSVTLATTSVRPESKLQTATCKTTECVVENVVDVERPDRTRSIRIDNNVSQELRHLTVLTLHIIYNIITLAITGLSHTEKDNNGTDRWTQCNV